MNDQMAPHKKVMNAWMAWLMAKHVLDKVDELRKNRFFQNWSTTVGKTKIVPKNVGAENIKAIANNLFVLSMGCCVVAAEEALEDKFGKLSVSSLKGSISNLIALRSVVYQIRNAFAHRPMSPKWDFRNKLYEREYHIAESGFDLRVDLRNLNDKRFSIAQIGGWEGFNSLIMYAIRQLEK